MNDKEILQFIGKRIRSLREARGYSQEDFSHLCGLDRTYISGIERGLRNVGLLNIEAIAIALNISTSELFVGYEPSSGQLSNLRSDYLLHPNAEIHCGFTVHPVQIHQAIIMSAQLMQTLPFSLFSSLDLKAISGMIGAVFINYLAEQVNGAIPNPIEKGHPDIIPSRAKQASEAKLRHYPEGLEIKCTVGNVTKGSNLKTGHSRIQNITGLTWQAHHREVKSLLGLVWDFAGCEQKNRKAPIITGVFFTDGLKNSDWGAISGIAGRNTKVTGMLSSGKEKMGKGWLVLLDSPEYLSRYEKALKFKIRE